MRAMLPESPFWNFTNSISDVKFVLRYSVESREVVVSGPDATSALTTPMPAGNASNAGNNSNVTHVVHPEIMSLSWSNGIGVNNVPCSAKRHGLNDAYSTLHLSPSRPLSSSSPKKKTVLGGQWTGTCNPRIPARAFDCNVDLNVDAVSKGFELIISGCAGFGVTNFAAGTMDEETGDVERWVDPINGRMSFRNVFVNYAHGVPDKTTRGWVGRASVFWKEATDWLGATHTDWSPDKLTLNVFRPGEGQLFPSQTIAWPDEQKATPCQVLHLTRIPIRSQQNAIGSMKSVPLLRALDLSFKYQDLYRNFNASLNAAKAAACQDHLRTFFNSSTTILSKELTISSSDCNSPCFLAMNASLSDFAREAGPLWKQFLAMRPPDTPATAGMAGLQDEDWAEHRRQYEVMHKFFAARVVHVAEFLARASLACTGNYKLRTCLEYANRLVSPWCRNSMGSPRKVTDVISLSLDPFNRDTSTDECLDVCRSHVEDMIVNGHCCAATFETVQRKWAAFVLQGHETIWFDISTYRCLYAQDVSAQGSQTRGEPCCWDTHPELVVARQPAQSVLTDKASGVCKSDQEAPAGGQSLKCAFDMCGSYTVPDECCVKLEVTCVPSPPLQATEYPFILSIAKSDSNMTKF